MKVKPNRNPANKYIPLIDRMNAVTKESGVNKVVLSELVGIEYVTLDKYLRKERNIPNEEVAKRMMITTNLLDELVKKRKLPIANEINSRLRTSVILEIIDDYINNEKLNS